MTTMIVDDGDGLIRHLLHHYPNLNLAGADLTDVFQRTPLEKFFNGKTWTKDEKWLKVHVSDMMRVALVWHWGGIYTDTDVICLKDMSHFSNTVAFQAPGILANGFFKFQSQHKVLKSYMKVMIKNYKPGVWGSMGPKSLSEVLKAECKVKDLRKLHPKLPLTCGDVSLLPPKQFYPIIWQNYKKYMEPGKGKNFTEDFKENFSLHVWNKLSVDEVVRKGSNSIYETAAKTHCPITYQYATRRSLTF
ncbi:lactosylceramide 4-alpha-galactosyltransferase-like [Homarus americanus]|uniref:lactosylceramide 4-alpha-galactosyltransferase-like n=1 Tax=Homarus americanus TaxID=6706 RepID=UPI001C437A66|nr:lactosylceramide 4-alpha-galactosyltransferase-like [Homarus americanus]